MVWREKFNELVFNVMISSGKKTGNVCHHFHGEDCKFIFLCFVLGLQNDVTIMETINMLTRKVSYPARIRRKSGGYGQFLGINSSSIQ